MYIHAHASTCIHSVLTKWWSSVLVYHLLLSCGKFIIYVRQKMFVNWSQNRPKRIKHCPCYASACSMYSPPSSMHHWQHSGNFLVFLQNQSSEEWGVLNTHWQTAVTPLVISQHATIYCNLEYRWIYVCYLNPVALMFHYTNQEKF